MVVPGEAPWRRKWELSLKRRSGEEEKKRGQGRPSSVEAIESCDWRGGQDEGDEGLLLQRVPLTAS